MNIHITIFIGALVLFSISGILTIAGAQEMVPYEIQIEKTHNSIQGTNEQVCVTLNKGSEDLLGFDFLIAYDNSVLSFVGAVPGDIYVDCNWEYFNYRYGTSGNCSSGCPAGLLRVVGLAETNNGENHPSCFLPPTLPEQLFCLEFLVTNDYTFECQFAPVRFFWVGCGSNTIAYNPSDDPTGYVRALAVSQEIHEFDGWGGNLANGNSGFPTYFGAQDGCLVPDGSGRPAPIRFIDYINGGVDIVCCDCSDDNGDINLNGLSNEAGDLDLFHSYFLYGISVFTINTAGQIAATDINYDGEPLKLEDFVQLGMIIVGNEPTILDSTIMGDNSVSNISNSGRILLNSDHKIDIISLQVLGDIILAVPSFPRTVEYHFDGTYSRILVSDFYGMGPGITELLQYSGDAEIISVQGATREGYEVPLTISNSSTGIGDNTDILPTDFILHQNYPNPFNLETVIQFELPRAAEVEFEVINLLGQAVYHFEKHYSAGTHSIHWNGNDQSGSTVGSGVYYYRIIAGDFVESKKMILLK